MLKTRADNAFDRSKRENRGSDYVDDGKILLTDTEGGFVVLNARPTIPGVYTLADIRYFGKIDLSNGMVHKCTCRSFYHGNVEEFLADHAENFECKHILGAYIIRELGSEHKPRVLLA